MDPITIEKTIHIKSRLKNELKKGLVDHTALLIDHCKLQEDYMKSLDVDINNRNDTKQAVTINTIMHREKLRNDHRCIRQVFKGNKEKGITSLEIPLNDGRGRYVTLTELGDILDQLLMRNIQHFGQADQTPFGMSPLIDVMEYEGINKAVPNMISNKVLPDELNNQPEYVRKLLEKLCYGNNLPPINKDITFEEFCSGLKIGEKELQRPHQVADTWDTTKFC
jgi:hypothetical protein